MLEEKTRENGLQVWGERAEGRLMGEGQRGAKKSNTGNWENESKSNKENQNKEEINVN